MAPFPGPTTVWHDTAYPSISSTRPELSAKGKNILVTGGGTGIGAQTARHFAQAGASRIALVGRRAKPLLDTKASIERDFPEVEVYTFPADVTNKAKIDVVFSVFVGTGKLDVLVSGAAIIGPQEPVADVATEPFLNAIDTNLRGSLFVAQAFLRHASDEAVAIDVNSSAAHLNFAPGFASYSIAKLAVFRLWDSVAFAHPNLSIFHIQPGVVDTDMNREAGGVDAVGFSDDVSLPASFNVWLASPEARFLKGKYLWTNWDVDELKAKREEIEGTRQLNIDLVGWPFGDPAWGTPWKTKST